MTPQIHLHILASGSKGNAAVVEGPGGLVLVDDGLSRRELLRRAAELSLPMDELRCLVVTHEHSDHVRGLEVWCKHWSGLMVTSPGTAGARAKLSGLPWRLVDPGDAFEACGMTVQTFPTSHDVAQPMGMVFRTEDDAVGYCTDTGRLTPAAKHALKGVRTLALESNHDPSMLRRGPYPGYLKDRVGGDFGHLSNVQAAEAAKALVTQDTECVVAMHLSQENNRPSLAVRALAEALGAEAACDTFTEARTPDGLLTVIAAGQDAPVTVW